MMDTVDVSGWKIRDEPEVGPTEGADDVNPALRQQFTMMSGFSRKYARA